MTAFGRRLVFGPIAIAALVLGSGMVGSGVAAAQPAPIWQPLAPIASLDVARYMGTWNQIAAVPQPFNLECARDTQATYTLLDPANVEVENRCTTWTGGASGITGNARVNDPVTNAQLHVSFPNVPTQGSPDGPTNYIVTYIADDYSWALVGDPFRVSGFVLSREPVVTDSEWRNIRFVVESRGYNSCELLTSPTTAANNDIRPLCTV